MVSYFVLLGCSCAWFIYLISGAPCVYLCGVIFSMLRQILGQRYLGGVYGFVSVGFYLCDGKPDIPVSL